MPAAAGDGFLGEPPAAEEQQSRQQQAAPGPEGSGSGTGPATWVSAAGCRERLRDFQHTKRVGNYLIGRKLGEGSFAKVREGLHVLTGEKVAVKVIDKKRAKKDTYVTKNLRREGQIQQMIRHPNIAQLLDILETENSYYLVMELCPGGNLMHKIYEKKRLEEHEARKYIRQLILAVEHLHRAGVVHRFYDKECNGRHPPPPLLCSCLLITKHCFSAEASTPLLPHQEKLKKNARYKRSLSLPCDTCSGNTGSHGQSWEYNPDPPSSSPVLYQLHWTTSLKENL